MRHRFPLRHLMALLLATSLTLGGCARGIPDAEPGDIPDLRTRLEASPGDAVLQTRLGIALYKADRHDEAARMLAGALQAAPRSEDPGAVAGAASLYLGLAQEAQENWSEARAAYSQYLEAGRYDPLKDEIRGRLALMARRELERQAEEALAQEAQLSDEPPAPRSIAVFPFRLTTDDPDLEPLGVALTDMMITDLTLAGGLTVLERARIQILLDEMALTDAGYTETATGARAGRLLRSEHVVQGALTRFGEEQIRFDANLVNTVSGSSAGGVDTEDELDRIFDLEKQAVFAVLDQLGIEITAAERQAINENRSENLLAFLSYGQGLMALDRGDYGSAGQFFNRAVELDPGFSLAQTRENETEQLQTASTTSTDAVATRADPELGGVAEEGALTGPGNNTTLANVNGGINPNPNSGTLDRGQTTTGAGDNPATDRKDPIQEPTGGETASKPPVVTIPIVIPNPTTGGGGGGS